MAATENFDIIVYYVAQFTNATLSGPGAQMARLTGHWQAVSLLQFSANSNMLASGSSDGTVRMWDMTACSVPTILRTFIMGPASGTGVTALTLSADSHMLVTTYNDHLALWDVNFYGGLFIRLPLEVNVVDAVLSWQNDLLVATSPVSPDPAFIQNFDARYGTFKSQLSELSPAILDLAVSTDSSFFASGSSDGLVKVYLPPPGHVVQNLTGHISSVHALSFSGDGRYLASMDTKAARLWGVAGNGVGSTGIDNRILVDVNAAPDGRKIKDIDLSRDGALLATLFYNCDFVNNYRLQVWSTTVGVTTPNCDTIVSSSVVNCVVFAPPQPNQVSQVALCLENGIRFFNALTGVLITPSFITDAPVKDVIYSADGTLLVVAYSNSFNIDIRDSITPSKLLTQFEVDSLPVAMSLSGNKLIVTTLRSVKMFDVSATYGYNTPFNVLTLEEFFFQLKGFNLPLFSRMKSQLSDGDITTCVQYPIKLQTLSLLGSVSLINFPLPGTYELTVYNSILGGWVSQQYVTTVTCPVGTTQVLMPSKKWECADCGPGTYNANEDGDCILCIGYVNEEKSACFSCPAGSEAKFLFNNGDYFVCESCGPSSYSPADGSPCLSCVGYVNANQTECFDCPIGTEATQILGSSPGSLPWWSCEACMNSTYSPQVGSPCLTCVGTVNTDHTQCLDCPAGTETVLLNRDSNTWGCVACAGSTYSPADGSPCLTCVGNVDETHTQCLDCPAGTEAVLHRDSDTWECIACVGSTYSPAAGSPCLRCTGRVLNSQTACEACPQNGPNIRYNSILILVFLTSYI